MIFEKDDQRLSLDEFERYTGAKWSEEFSFESPLIPSEIAREASKLYKKGEMTLEQLWLGRYFQKEITSRFTPDVSIRWIDHILGWGVFAMRDFKKMQFIAEYTGRVRKRRKADEKNAYCFEYLVCQGFRSHYTIDAMDQGGIARYINHSDTPNLNSSLATFENMSHVVLYTKEPIAKGSQLCYDYGPDYWSKRKAPIPI